MPYLRHRWAIAALLGLDETDRWPQLRRARSAPSEVQAVYPHLGAVAEGVWLGLFGSAEQDIGILTETAEPIAGYPRVMEMLPEKAALGVRTRICLPDPADPAFVRLAGAEKGDTSAASAAAQAIAAFACLLGVGQVEIRLHRAVTYAAIFCADDQLMAAQRAYGIPATYAPMLSCTEPGAAASPRPIWPASRRCGPMRDHAPHREGAVVRRCAIRSTGWPCARITQSAYPASAVVTAWHEDRTMSCAPTR